jgi:putative endopeptidase
MVIGHEIHTLTTKQQYDKEGNVKTGGQKTITRSLNQEYSKSSIGTVRLQYWTVYKGDMTVGENTADIAGIATMLTGQDTTKLVITPDQRFYLLLPAYGK